MAEQALAEQWTKQPRNSQKKPRGKLSQKSNEGNWNESIDLGVLHSQVWEHNWGFFLWRRTAKHLVVCFQRLLGDPMMSRQILSLLNLILAVDFSSIDKVKNVHLCESSAILPQISRFNQVKSRWGNQWDSLFTDLLVTQTIWHVFTASFVNTVTLEINYLKIPHSWKSSPKSWKKRPNSWKSSSHLRKSSPNIWKNLTLRDLGGGGVKKTPCVFGLFFHECELFFHQFGLIFHEIIIIFIRGSMCSKKGEPLHCSWNAQLWRGVFQWNPLWRTILFVRKNPVCEGEFCLWGRILFVRKNYVCEEELRLWGRILLKRKNSVHVHEEEKLSWEDFLLLGNVHALTGVVQAYHVQVGTGRGAPRWLPFNIVYNITIFTAFHMLPHIWLFSPLFLISLLFHVHFLSGSQLLSHNATYDSDAVVNKSRKQIFSSDRWGKQTSIRWNRGEGGGGSYLPSNTLCIVDFIGSTRPVNVVNPSSNNVYCGQPLLK